MYWHRLTQLAYSVSNPGEHSQQCGDRRGWRDWHCGAVVNNRAMTLDISSFSPPPTLAANLATGSKTMFPGAP